MDTGLANLHKGVRAIYFSQIMAFGNRWTLGMEKTLVVGNLIYSLQGGFLVQPYSIFLVASLAVVYHGKGGWFLQIVWDTSPCELSKQGDKLQDNVGAKESTLDT